MESQTRWPHHFSVKAEGRTKDVDTMKIPLLILLWLGLVIVELRRVVHPTCLHFGRSDEVFLNPKTSQEHIHYDYDDLCISVGAICCPWYGGGWSLSNLPILFD
jgi:hypothetical protein